jgi:apolipoprotein N-acyltransferase
MNPGPDGVTAVTPEASPEPTPGITPIAGATDEVPWRPSRLRMTRRTTDTVRPGRGRVALPAVASGVGLALSLPPWGFWVLAFPAAGLLWWRLGGLRPRTRLWAGWLAGLGCYVPGLLFARAFTLAGAAVLIAFEALFVGVACLAVPRGPVVARALAFPAAVTLAEAARQNWPFGGLPIGGVFLGQAGGPVLGVARLGGPLGLTLAVYVGGVGLGALGSAAARAVRDRSRIAEFDGRHGVPPAELEGSGVGPFRHGSLPVEPDPLGTVSGPADGTSGWRGAVAGLGTLGATGAVALVALVGSGAVAARAPDGGPSVGTVTAVAVQGGGVRGFRKSQVDPAVVLAAAVAATEPLTDRAPGTGPQLVLWPEDVVALVGPLDGSAEEAVLSRLAVSLHATLVVGVTETLSDTAFRNEVVAFGPDGTVVSRFEKVHRVPFGEYVPWRSFFARLGDLSAVSRDAVPGTGSGVLTTPVGPLGTMISYEVFYADRGRTPVRAGAQLLIVPTNTSSYAAAQVPTQEIAASQVQAVQQGRDLLQAAPTGYSAWITHRGDLLARSVLGARQVVPAVLHRRTGTTVYVRWGDTPVLVASVLALAAGWWLAVRRAGRPYS